MTIEIKQSTAHTFLLGPFVDKDDGVAVETGLATAMDSATTGIRLSKNGGSMADRNDATVPVHDEDGFYTVVLNTTDTNTLGLLQVEYSEPATALPAWKDFSVVTANYWDSKYGADIRQVDLIEIGGVAQSATDLKDFADDGYDPGSNKITGCVLTDTVTTNSDMRGTENAALASVLGALADAAADGDPTSADTIMQYLKQIINTLEGAVGLPIFPAEQAPGANISMVEVLRAIHADVTGIAGSAMIGTNSAALASEVTAARMSELDAGTGGKMANQVDIIQTDTSTDIPALLPSALINGKMDSDMEAINDDTAAAVSLKTSMGQVISGAAEGTPTVTTIQTDLAETQDDIYIGRTVIFTSGAAKDEATDITDYTGSTGTLEVTALANAPASTDTFIII